MRDEDVRAGRGHRCGLLGVENIRRREEFEVVGLADHVGLEVEAHPGLLEVLPELAVIQAHGREVLHADALLGSATAYLALAVGHLSDLGNLSRVPVLFLAITILGVPVAATLTGWILAGRQPPSIARRVLE
jgi:hypothetical protein